MFGDVAFVVDGVKYALYIVRHSGMFGITFYDWLTMLAYLAFGGWLIRRLLGAFNIDVDVDGAGDSADDYFELMSSRLDDEDM